jgi:hypothetical protein
MGQQEFTRFTGIMDCRPSKEKNPFSWCELGLFPLYVSPVKQLERHLFGHRCLKLEQRALIKQDRYHAV